MIQKDREYQTKCGYKVEIYRTENVNFGGIAGAYLTPEGWQMTEWDHDGIWYGTWTPGGIDKPSEMDLIEAPVYLSKNHFLLGIFEECRLPVHDEYFKRFGIKIYGYEPEIKKDKTGASFVVFKKNKDY